MCIRTILGRGGAAFCERARIVAEKTFSSPAVSGLAAYRELGERKAQAWGMRASVRERANVWKRI